VSEANSIKTSPVDKAAAGGVLKSPRDCETAR
jgi:hypothetical protein